MRSVLALLALVPFAAGADIIYDNGGPQEGGTTITSDLDNLFDPLPPGSEDYCNDPANICYQEAADDFFLASAATVTGIDWWGVYTSANQFDAVPDDFTIRILDEFFGLVAEVNVGTVARADTGLDALLLSTPRDIFGYEATFSSIFLDAGQYYLSIVNNTAGDDIGRRWSWQSTTGITGSSTVARTSNTAFTDYTTGWDSADTGQGPFDLAFRLNSATPVPEPSSLALLGLGLAGMGMTRRRRKP